MAEHGLRTRPSLRPPPMKSPNAEPAPHLTAGSRQRQMGEPKLPPNPSTLQDRPGREARLVLGPGCSEGPARLTCLPPLPLRTQWPFLQPCPHWLQGPASQCCLCAREADLSGWGVGSIPHRAFVSSQRDGLPQLILELPPAGSRCIPEPQPLLRRLPQHSHPNPLLSQKPQRRIRCDLPPNFLCTPDLPLGPD